MIPLSNCMTNKLLKSGYFEKQVIQYKLIFDKVGYIPKEVDPKVPRAQRK